MRTTGRLVAVVVLMSGLIGCAGTGRKEDAAQQPPRPSAEQKAFDVWTGTWTYEGEAKDSPLGPAGKFTGRAIGRPILNGFFFELRFEEKDWQSVQIYWYDAAVKSYRHTGFASDGSAWAGTGTWNEGTWSAVWTTAHRGAEYHGRSQIVLAADGKSITNPVELSVDGTKWAPLGESKWAKISGVPAAPPEFYASAPKPEMKPMEVFLGTWKHEDVTQETPLGPAGKFSFTHTGRWILGGSFLEARVETEKNEHWLEIDWYDTNAKCFRAREFDDNGMTWSGTLVGDGNRWTWSGSTTVKGVEHHFRNSGLVSDDKNTMISKSEYSADGKTWQPAGTGKLTKIAEP